MIKEERTVWTQDGQEVLIRKNLNEYTVPGCTFTLAELKKLVEACSEAIHIADGAAEGHTEQPPF